MARNNIDVFNKVKTTPYNAKTLNNNLIHIFIDYFLCSNFKIIRILPLFSLSFKQVLQLKNK